MSLLKFRRLAIRPSSCRYCQPLGRGVERERYRSTAGRPFDRAEGRSMQFFVLARRRTESFAEAQFAELLDAEAARVRELYGDGVIRSAYSRADVPGGRCANFTDHNTSSPEPATSVANPSAGIRCQTKASAIVHGSVAQA